MWTSDAGQQEGPCCRKPDGPGALGGGATQVSSTGWQHVSLANYRPPASELGTQEAGLGGVPGGFCSAPSLTDRETEA